MHRWRTSGNGKLAKTSLYGNGC